MEEMRAKSEGEWRQRVELVREELRNSLSQALAEKDASTTEARRYKVTGDGRGVRLKSNQPKNQHNKIQSKQ